jgi:SAM-dependent methyltransferase
MTKRSDGASWLESPPEQVNVLSEPVYEPYEYVATLLTEGSEVLDIGCGNGKVGLFLSRTGAAVDGIETSEARAEIARTRLRHVSTQPPGPNFTDASIGSAYNVILCLDLLEHLVDPRPTLTWAAGCLAKNGRLCALIPNSAHWRFRLKMLRGDWSYADSGLFDRTHVRFYDADTMTALCPSGLREVKRAFYSPHRWDQRMILIAPRLFALHVLIEWSY